VHKKKVEKLEIEYREKITYSVPFSQNKERSAGVVDRIREKDWRRGVVTIKKGPREALIDGVTIFPTVPRGESVDGAFGSTGIQRQVEKRNGIVQIFKDAQTGGARLENGSRNEACGGEGGRNVEEEKTPDKSQPGLEALNQQGCY